MIIKILSLTVILVCLSGCVEHRVSIHGPYDSTVDKAVVNADLQEPPQQALSKQSPFPIEIAGSWWGLDGQGRMRRSDIHVRTKLHWWQRFPFDIVTDALVPYTFTSERVAIIQTQLIGPYDRERIDHEAVEHGYD